MHKKEYLPACYRYIKEDNRSHILFTLATKNTKNKSKKQILLQNFIPSCVPQNCHP